MIKLVAQLDEITTQITAQQCVRSDPPTWQGAEQVLQSQGLGFHLKMRACNGDKHKIQIENQTGRFEHLICPRTKELDNASILTKVGDGLGRHAKPVKTFRYQFPKN